MDLRIRPTSEEDLAFVLALEADADAAPFILGWSRERHTQAIADDDEAHLIVAQADAPVGFVLLAGLASEHRSIQLRRIVTERKGAGRGRETIGLVLDHAFGELGAHRVWLDVKPHNERARRAYTACGFVFEGRLREALRVGGAYESLLVMSVLEQEWAARPDRP
jgi:diamine N-acetyltransferase